MSSNNLRYTVDEHNFTVEVFDDDNPTETGAPFLRQPSYPNGDHWSKAEATAWAEAVLASFADDTAPLPGPSAAEPTVSRPDPADAPRELSR